MQRALLVCSVLIRVLPEERDAHVLPLLVLFLGGPAVPRSTPQNFRFPKWGKLQILHAGVLFIT